MSYRVEFLIRCELETDLPENVKDVLTYLFDKSDSRKWDEDITFNIDHDFFRDTCFKKIGRFIYDINCSYLSLEYGCLASINDFKNDTYLIYLFLDWIVPYIKEYEDGKVIGWIFHDEIIVPELIYFRIDDDCNNKRIEFHYAEDITKRKNYEIT